MPTMMTCARHPQPMILRSASWPSAVVVDHGWPEHHSRPAWSKYRQAAFEPLHQFVTRATDHHTCAVSASRSDCNRSTSVSVDACATTHHNTCRCNQVDSATSFFGKTLGPPDKTRWPTPQAGLRNFTHQFLLKLLRVLVKIIFVATVRKHASSSHCE